MSDTHLTVSYHGGLNAGALVVLSAPLDDPETDKDCGVRAVEPGGEAHGIANARGDSGDVIPVTLFGWEATTELTHWNGQTDLLPGTPLFALAHLGPDASPLPVRGVCPLGPGGQAGHLIGVSMETLIAADTTLPHRLRVLFFSPNLGTINGGG